MASHPWSLRLDSCTALLAGHPRDLPVLPLIPEDPPRSLQAPAGSQGRRAGPRGLPLVEKGGRRAAQTPFRRLPWDPPLAFAASPFLGDLSLGGREPPREETGVSVPPSRVPSGRRVSVHLEDSPNHHLVPISGLHTWQRVYGCELQGEESKGGFDQFGYDGRIFLSFDKETLTWVAPVPQAQISQRKWDAVPGLNQGQKSYLEEICIEWLERYLSYGKETLLRTELPVMTLSRKIEVEDGMETHVCRLDGFYPREIEASWTRDGEVWLQDTLRGSVAPNADGSFHSWLSIQIDPKERGRYRCHVEHDSLQKPLDVALEEPKSSLGIIIGCVVAGLVLLGVIVGIWFFKGGKEKVGHHMIRKRHFERKGGLIDASWISSWSPTTKVLHPFGPADRLELDLGPTLGHARKLLFEEQALRAFASLWSTFLRTFLSPDSPDNPPAFPSPPHFCPSPQEAEGRTFAFLSPPVQPVAPGRLPSNNDDTRICFFYWLTLANHPLLLWVVALLISRSASFSACDFWRADRSWRIAARMALRSLSLLVLVAVALRESCLDYSQEENPDSVLFRVRSPSGPSQKGPQSADGTWLPLPPPQESPSGNGRRGGPPEVSQVYLGAPERSSFPPPKWRLWESGVCRDRVSSQTSWLPSHNPSARLLFPAFGGARWLFVASGAGRSRLGSPLASAYRQTRRLEPWRDRVKAVLGMQQGKSLERRSAP
ncbi:H-2 class I histocompatibility antigen Q9 alpha chain-like [Crotalus adamanteus]|uniref:H-2 class I histocompatibility antigen Q9 alpha chain-like n=1 Tax=Crotalus adamanteus TaxID=8729 RepID=A0AAW1BUM1_CROAD